MSKEISLARSCTRCSISRNGESSGPATRHLQSAYGKNPSASWEPMRQQERWSRVNLLWKRCVEQR